MPRIVVVEHEGCTLGFNSEDIESYEMRRDVEVIADQPLGIRDKFLLGKSHLSLNFKDGTEPTWETKEN